MNSKGCLIQGGLFGLYRIQFCILVGVKRFKSVDEFMAKQEVWINELVQLRTILEKTELEETVKWGLPVYTSGGKNIVGIGGFKDFFALWFFQGALLEDKYNVLINAQKGKTRAMRQWRFSSAKEINESKIIDYVKEAIDNQRAGKEIKPRKKKTLAVPQQLKSAFNQDQELKFAFESLSLSCRREYTDYISEAKRERTRVSRLEKIIPMIKERKGLNDKYR